MIKSFRLKLSRLSRAVPVRPAARPGRRARARLGFYGYQYRKARKRSALIARGALGAALLLATLAAASGQLGR